MNKSAKLRKEFEYDFDLDTPIETFSQKQPFFRTRHVAYYEVEPLFSNLLILRQRLLKSLLKFIDMGIARLIICPALAGTVLVFKALSRSGNLKFRSFCTQSSSIA